MYKFHAHTHYCDGSAEPEVYIIEAIKQNFKVYGFSGHSPIPIPNNFALTEETMPLYCNEIERLKEKYKGQIDVLLGMEADFIPALTTPFDDFRTQFRLDYIIGSVHIVKNSTGDIWFVDGPVRQSYDDGLKLFFNNDIQRAVTSFYHQTNLMLESEHFEIIGHFDKITMYNQNRFFTSSEPWYRKLVTETIALIKEEDVVVEINSRGLYKKRSSDFFPEAFILKHLYDAKIPVMINSDAHAPHEISLVHREAIAALKNVGFKERAIIDARGVRIIALE
jgi:histidinol-phosphatase (PHP family)